MVSYSPAAVAAMARVRLGATRRWFDLHFETRLSSSKSSSIWDREEEAYLSLVLPVIGDSLSDSGPLAKQRL